ncbi:MAG: tetratricopeptide repeat protein [Acidiferrobacterales bacterium]
MAVELNIDTLFESAQQADREGRVEAALAGYNQVLARAPTHVGALYQKAMLAFQANRLEESLTLLQDARAARPDDAEINMSLGLCCCSRSGPRRRWARSSRHRPSLLCGNSRI